MDEQGNIIGLKIPETNNASFLRYSVWTVVLKDNPSAKKAVLVTDTLLFKSA